MTPTATSAKTLFLDFDGVLHPSTAILGLDVYRLGNFPEQTCRDQGLMIWAQELADVLETTDVDIIVHSSWRLQPWCTMGFLRRVLPSSLSERLAGILSPDIRERHAAIQYAVSRGGLQEQEYLVLDDDKAAFPPGFNRLVSPSPALGISDPSVREALGSWARGQHTAQASRVNLSVGHHSGGGGGDGLGGRQPHMRVSMT